MSEIIYIYAYLALATRESVDIEELVDDFVTFYVAGQETTSNMLTFALVLTLQHPNVLERLIIIIIYIYIYTKFNVKWMKFWAKKTMSLLGI